MSSDTLIQTSHLIKKAKTILVVFKMDLAGDTLAASLALNQAIKKLGKQVAILSDGDIAGKFSFLPFVEEVGADHGARGGLLVVKILNARDKMGEFWYEEDGRGIKIFISPKPGMVFRESELETELQGLKPDLIVCIGVTALETLGKLYQKKAALFFETPLINIDIGSSNEGYGAVNLVDLTATANSEIVFELVEHLDKNLFDQDVATLLLAGIIAKTDSFQSIKTTPRAFFIAARLMEMGGQQQEIIKNLYKTKTLSLLKLWGRALARLDIYPEFNFVSAAINYQDLTGAGASADDVGSVAEELVNTLSDAKVILFLAEIAGRTARGFIFAKPQFNLDDLMLDLRGQRISPGLISFTLKDTELPEARDLVKRQVIDWLKSLQSV